MQIIIGESINIQNLDAMDLNEETHLLAEKGQSVPIEFLSAFSGSKCNVKLHILPKLDIAYICLSIGNITYKQQGQTVLIVCNDKFSKSLNGLKFDDITLKCVTSIPKTRKPKATTTKEVAPKEAPKKETKTVRTTKTKGTDEELLIEAGVKKADCIEVIAAIQASSDSKIGFPICLKTECAKNGKTMSEDTVKEITDKIQKVYKKIKKA